ncbi:helix-turn-helix domain-containing protein [Paracoccus sp. M683]|uniref:XRE family transcriptional regulator n=1 Tax=Paracoccus sp. M683 TaxID=2594268 RepID=UPI0011803C67|nr:XRE family transcriptional regulator [Paracoccus sp. M683]TRW97293.1 helix-turn-helix domain-containing protein [Paracoccus sp. M683]
MTKRSPTHVLTGTRIRERRLALARKQADVAQAAGISAAYLNLIEHNRRPVGDALVARLAVALEVPAAELESGREEARLAALREAVAALDGRLGTGLPELEQTAEFAARFPGWADALVAAAAQNRALSLRLVSLSERMTQDPYLLATLHEVLSAVTALRSTAAILAEGDEGLTPAWRERFFANLDHDSQRLSTTAQALVAYLDSFEADSTFLTPQDEVEAWMTAGSPPLDQATDLASDAARDLARAHLERMAAERAALPDADLARAASGAPDPLAVAQMLGRPLDLVMRRLAALRPRGYEGAGLLVCDGAGVMVLRRAAQGFALPRQGDACALWPLFRALINPQAAIRLRVEMPGGARFDTFSFATRIQPAGLDGPVLSAAQMLILPAGPDPAHDAVLRVGPSCRICPRDGCPARREPSILAPA